VLAKSVKAGHAGQAFVKILEQHMLYKDGLAQGDTTCPLHALVSVKGDATVFVETGTNVGAGVQNALNAGFERVVSIEVIEQLHMISFNRFKDDQRVKLLLGNSRTDLFPAISDINDKILFWLDGHEFYDIPLLEELSQIKNLNRNDYTILIDDVRMFGTDLWGGFQLKPVIDFIMSINHRYVISYIDTIHGKGDILVAKVP